MDYSQLVQDALDGNESALKAYAILKSEHAKFATYIKEIEPAAFSEASNWDEKTFKLEGYKFTKRQGGKRWDFSELKEWQEAKSKLKDIEERAKLAYANYDKGLMAVTLDGDVKELPIVTYSKDSVSITKLKSS